MSVDLNKLHRELELVRINHFGACPKYKGHFDFLSSFVGFMVGAFVGVAGLIAILASLDRLR